MYGDFSIGRLIFLAKQLIEKGILEKNEAGREWMKLGEILLVLKRRDNISVFEEHCREVGVSQRTAYYFIELYRIMEANQLTPPPDISWRKLAETFPVLTRSNATSVFNYCRTHKRREITQWVERQRK